MPGWIDRVLGVTEGTRTEAELRKTYTRVLDHLPAGGVVDHLHADGSHLKIYIAQHHAQHTRSTETP